jgi:hypothetical protein
LFPAADSAKNQADRRVFTFLTLVTIQLFQVKFPLPLIPGLECAAFQLYGHKTLEGTVVKKFATESSLYNSCRMVL